MKRAKYLSYKGNLNPHRNDVFLFRNREKEIHQSNLS